MGGSAALRAPCNAHYCRVGRFYQPYTRHWTRISPTASHASAFRKIHVATAAFLADTCYFRLITLYSEPNRAPRAGTENDSWMHICVDHPCLTRLAERSVPPGSLSRLRIFVRMPVRRQRENSIRPAHSAPNRRREGTRRASSLRCGLRSQPSAMAAACAFGHFVADSVAVGARRARPQVPLY